MTHSSDMSLGLRICSSLLAGLLIAIILMKPHSGLFIDAESDAMETTTIIDEKDFEGESFVEFDPEFLSEKKFVRLSLEPNNCPFLLSIVDPLISVYDEVVLPPPEV